MIERETIIELVNQELKDANKKYPLFHSPHEAYGVLLEEADEVMFEVDRIDDAMADMWRRVKTDLDIEKTADYIYAHAVNGIRELIQVAAMCEKIKQSKLYEEKE